MIVVYREVVTIIKNAYNGEVHEATDVECSKIAFRLAGVAVKNGGVINKNDFNKMKGVVKKSDPILPTNSSLILFDFSYYIGRVMMNRLPQAHWFLNTKRSRGELVPQMCYCNFIKHGIFGVNIHLVLHSCLMDELKNEHSKEFINWFKHIIYKGKAAKDQVVP